ncbi:hypothetical protein GCM10010082_07090 [Kushneria pakistanensis]|uniref:Lipoprotein n=1 Tax=Kushneria pakistanensis TaxID=1508770 RepID=A0ABQ3FCN2_9GAMM|nr:hypothetical protein [Kushneria pakistanensis]GHC18295.1 hypothetical protein GCM10010082_07090 [Kushneria pakistanensis]
MKGKTIAAASLAFVMALGLSACNQDDPADEAGDQAQEANQSSQYMDGEGANATSDGAAEQAGTDNGTMDPESGGTTAMPEDDDMDDDSGTMQGMNEAQESTDESTGAREGGTGHSATNAGSSGAMSQAGEADQFNNSSSNNTQ